MRKIDLSTYSRKGLYTAFKDRAVPVWSVVCTLDLGRFKSYTRQHRLGFFIPLSYLISLAVNRVPELRHRIIDDELYEFDTVDPGFTVLLDDDTFSFCDAKHFDHYSAYRDYAQRAIEAVKRQPDLRTVAKHQQFFITNLPWLSFTAISHPYDARYASVPVVSIGKLSRPGAAVTAPVGLQVHHGVVDGLHVGRFYEALTELCASPADALALDAGSKP